MGRPGDTERAAGGPSWRWATAPPLPPVDRAPSRAAQLLLVAWIGVLGPVLRAQALPASRPFHAGAVGIVGAVVIWLTARRPWWLRWAIAAAVAAALLPVQGELIALWCSSSLLLGAWVAMGSSPGPRLPVASRDAVAPVVLLATVAAVLGTAVDATWQPLVPLAAAWGVAAFGHLGGGLFHRLAGRFGDLAGTIVATVAFEVLAIVTVLIPWAVQRSLAIDPLARAPGWARRDRRRARPASPWADEATVPPSSQAPSRSRSRTAGAVLVVVALLAAMAAEQRDRSHPTTALSRSTVPATSGSRARWHRQYQADIRWMLDERVALRGFEAYRVRDAETTTVNVHDGQRDTWRSPPCDCRRLRVWLYGGSAAFGLEQRDDHTIASDLARIARRDGLVLDVENRGMPGQLHWRNAFRLAWDLTIDPPPDIVLFYEGAADVDAAIELAASGRGDTRSPYEPFAEDRYDELAHLPSPGSSSGDPKLSWSTVSDLGSSTAGHLAAVRFERSRQVAAETAAQAGVRVRWFWQPTSHAHRPDADRAGSGAPSSARAAAFAEAAHRLDPVVTDLSGALDDIHAPVFADESNPDERGARAIAAAMYRSLRPQLRAIVRDGPP